MRREKCGIVFSVLIAFSFFSLIKMYFHSISSAVAIRKCSLEYCCSRSYCICIYAQCLMLSACNPLIVAHCRVVGGIDLRWV